MNLKRLAVAGVTTAAVAAVPAAASAKTLIGSGSSARSRTSRRCSSGTTRSTRRSSSSTRPTAATPASRTCSRARASSPHSAAAAADRLGTTLRRSSSSTASASRQPGEQADEPRTISQVRGHLPRDGHDELERVPGLGPRARTIAAFGRDSTAGTYTFFQSAVLERQDAGVERHAADSDGLVANAVDEEPERDRLRRASRTQVKGSGAQAAHAQRRRRAPPSARQDAQYPLSRYVWFVLAEREPRTPGARSSSDWVRTS